jgi:PTH1 family peptidyl-tRNA hydrolase
MVVDALSSRVGGRFKAHRAHALVVEGRLAGQRVVVAKPASFMNESGGPVAGLRSFFDVEATQIVVIHDELDLEFGVLRLKLGGGDNGHNGLRSITKSLATKDYVRVRFGIGRPPGRMDPATFVLSNFGPAERKELALHIDSAADVVAQVLEVGVLAVQNTLHG